MSEDVRGLVCQMSHASLQTEPIINWTRTCDDAVVRHAKSEGDKGDKTSLREGNVADLVVAKLEYLKGPEKPKVE